MVNFQQFKLALTFISGYIFVAHIAIDSLHKQSAEAINRLAGNSTTLLVVAHPDDETMFFGPTIIHLLNNNKSLMILCMSNGNADNNGRQREQEFADVIMALGPSVTLNVIKDSHLQDNMTVDWNSNEVVHYISKQIDEHDKAINTLITFDSYGVSGHANHRSIYSATKDLKEKLAYPKVSFYVLKSVTFFRKYSTFLDAVITIVTDYMNKITRRKEMTVAINFNEHAKLKQILQLHQSQMVWYRQLYMMFSRFMFINNLELLD